VAFIYLDENDLIYLSRFLPSIEPLVYGENQVTEKQLEKILYHLPKQSYIRDYLQKAGQNIFGWKRW